MKLVEHCSMMFLLIVKSTLINVLMGTIGSKVSYSDAHFVIFHSYSSSISQLIAYAIFLQVFNDMTCSLFM